MMEFETEVIKEEVEKLYQWANEKNDRFPNMTYEEGIIAAIDFFYGDCKLEELLEE